MIFDIQRFSTHDGPGIRTVVFLKGCTLSCAWCENPESQAFVRELLYTKAHCVGCRTCLAAENGGAVEADPAGGIAVVRGVEPPVPLGTVCPALALRIAGREATVPEIMAEVTRDADFFRKSGGGLTVSGGEPLAQIGFTEELLRAAVAEGIDSAIETCLAVDRRNVERATAFPLHWLTDLKHTDPDAFRKGTGGDVSVPLGNLAYLAGRGADLTIRVPVIPGFNDDGRSMRGILEFAAALPRPAGGGRRLDLLPYHDLASGKYAALGRTYPFPPGTKIDPDRLETYAELGRSLGLAITIGG